MREKPPTDTIDDQLKQLEGIRSVSEGLGSL